jgi:hypothetical protein
MLTHAQRTQIKLARARGDKPEKIAESLGIEVRHVFSCISRGARICSVPKYGCVRPRYRTQGGTTMKAAYALRLGKA